MTRVLSYPLKLPLLRQADGLGFQEEAAGLHPWELCTMEQGTRPGLAGVTGVSKEGSYREDTNPKIPFCVSDSSAPRVLQSRD